MYTVSGARTGTLAVMNRVTYLLMVVVAVFALTSVAIAVATADECGDLDARKSWVVVPPHWDCG
jgi:hypothetical protein